MRIAFLGKGGSGKTSIAAAYIHYLRKRGITTLAMDVDVNAHLQHALGLAGENLLLAKRFDEVARFLEGQRTDYKSIGVENIPCFGTVPPCPTSRFIRVRSNDPFLSHYGLQEGTLSLLTVGPHEEDDFSSTCYHFNLNTVELIYHRLIDGAQDRVVTDSAAGTDSLGTSLYMVHDLSVFVVEPTAQSVSVFNDYHARVKELGVEICCLWNKVRDDRDRAFLKAAIPAVTCIGEVPHSVHLKRFEQGDPAALGRFVDEQEELLGQIDRRLTSMQKDWDKYYQKLTALYDAECRRWWNGYYQHDLCGQYAASFDYASLYEQEKL